MKTALFLLLALSVSAPVSIWSQQQQNQAPAAKQQTAAPKAAKAQTPIQCRGLSGEDYKDCKDITKILADLNPKSLPAIGKLPTQQEAANMVNDKGGSLDEVNKAVAEAKATELRAIDNGRADLVQADEIARLNSGAKVDLTLSDKTKTNLADAAKVTDTITTTKGCVLPRGTIVTAECGEDTDAEKEDAENAALEKKCPHSIRIGSTKECVLFRLGQPQTVNGDPYEEQLVYGDGQYIYISRSTGKVTFYQY